MLSHQDQLRREQLAEALTRLEQRIGAACRAAGRPRQDVTLIAVTKTWPTSDVARLAELGVTDVGENRDHEARAKAAALPGLGLRWHFVGQVQTRKARSVASYADVIHSVDRDALATALSAGADLAGRTVDVLIQVNVALDDDSSIMDERSSRGGVAPAGVLALAARVVALPALRLAGCMTVAPPGQDPARAFAALAQVAARLQAHHRSATVVSAGMSGDVEAAVAAGATHLRVGTALLGHRPPLLD